MTASASCATVMLLKTSRMWYRLVLAMMTYESTAYDDSTTVHGKQIPPEIRQAIADRSTAGLTQMFLGDVFRGVSSDYKLHGVVLNYLKLLWKRRTDSLWARFCAPEN